MSQYLYTPAGAPGSTPAGLTPFGASHPGDWTIQSAGGVPVVQGLRNAAPGGIYGLSLDAAAADPASNAVDVRGKFLGGTDTEGGLCFARATGAAGKESFVYASLAAAFSMDGVEQGVTVGQYVNGEPGINSSTLLSYTPGTLYAYRFQAAGNRLRLKVWPAGSAEPARWRLDTGGFTVLGAGKSGIYAPEIAAPQKWQAFSLGTGGDAAPAV